MNWKNVDIRDAFFDELYKLAKNDSNLVFVTADMGAASLEKFKQDMPKQYINAGIAEQNAITVAAGLAMSGKKVFVYSITNFIVLRCFEQIKISLCYMNLPVTVVGVGTGFTYGTDGPTHYTLDDITVMRGLPITIYGPSDAKATAASARMAYENQGPVYVRIEKGKYDTLYEGQQDFSDGLALLKKGRILIISTSSMVYQALEVAKKIEEEYPLTVGVLDVYRIKPLNKELLSSYIEQADGVVTLEEHVISGGIGSAISEFITDGGLKTPLERIAVASQKFPKYGNREWMLSACNIDIESTVKRIERLAKCLGLTK